MDTVNSQDNTNENRYELFISKVKEAGEVWTLVAHEGFYAMFEDENENSLLPVWPDKESADICATDDWADYTPESMVIKEFREWLIELKEDLVLVGVFPGTDHTSYSIDPLQLNKRLKEKDKPKI